MEQLTNLGRWVVVTTSATAFEDMSFDWDEIDRNMDGISETAGVEESQWREGSTHTSSSMPGSTDLGLREIDEIGQNGTVRSVFTKVFFTRKQ
jgi:hypothetical protein